LAGEGEIMVGRLILAALLVATFASAQRGGGGGRGGDRGGSGMESFPSPRPQRLSRMQQFSEKLKLDKEQIEQVNEILRAALEKAAPLSAQLDGSRTQIASAMIEAKTAEEIGKLVDAHAGLEAQMDTLEADAFAKIFAILKANQQPKAGQAFELMAGIFDRAAMQGGGRRGR
jgi:hypothetical protein